VIRAATIALLVAAPPSRGSAATVESGALSATVHESPWHVEYDAVLRAAVRMQRGHRRCAKPLLARVAGVALGRLWSLSSDWR
jgi:hypothetical protein